MSKVDFKLTNYGFKNQNLGGRTVFTKMVLLPATSILRITVAAATILQDPTNNCGLMLPEMPAVVTLIFSVSILQQNLQGTRTPRTDMAFIL